MEKSGSNTLEEAIESSQKFIMKEYSNYWNERKELIKRFDLQRRKIDFGYTAGFTEEILAWNAFNNEAFQDATEYFESAERMIFNNTVNHQDISVASRRALCLYFAGLSQYLLHQTGGGSESYKNAREILIRAQASSQISWFQRLNRLDFLEIKNEDLLISGQDEDIEIADLNPENFFGPIIWNHPSFDETLKKSFESAFKTIKIGATDVAGERVHTLIERAMRNLVINLELDYEGDIEKLGISELISVFRDNNAITRNSLKYWLSEQQSPGRLRTEIVHQRYDTDTIEKIREALYKVKEGLTKLFSDARLYDFLYTKLMGNKLQILDELGKKYRTLTITDKKDEIIQQWSNGTLQIDDPITEDDRTVLSLVIVVKGKKGFERKIVLP